jgi:hypothetical protein
MMRRALAVVAVATIMFPIGAIGQTTAQSVQARRDQLVKVQEQLADPDPLVRLAYMEEIMSSGDALRMQIAMRTAFASDDPDLRAIALRGYLAGHKEFTFDIVLPPAMQKAYEERTPKTEAELDRTYPQLRTLVAWSQRIHFIVTDYKFGDSSGEMKTTTSGAAKFNFTGDTVSTVQELSYVGQCYFDFGPTNKQTLDGTMSCPNWPKLVIRTRAF